MSYIIATSDEKTIIVDGVEKSITPVVATRDSTENAILGVGYWVAADKELYLFDPLPSNLVRSWRAMQLLSHTQRVVTHTTLEACWCAFTSPEHTKEEVELLILLREQIGNDAHYDELVKSISLTTPSDMELKTMLSIVREKKIRCDLGEIRYARERDPSTLEYLLLDIETQREYRARVKKDDEIAAAKQNAQRRVSVANRTTAPTGIWRRLPRFIAENLKIPFTWRKSE